MRRGIKQLKAISGVLAFALVLAGGAYATDLVGFPDTEGHTTLEQMLQGDGASYETLSVLDVEQVDKEYIVRDAASLDPAPLAQAGRASRRRSLAYFSQLTDFQLADEESPARVEFADPGASSAWRPMEAFHPFVIDASIRQINRFVPSSPVPQGDGTGNTMDFALLTGDQADNQQRNEMIWTRELIEGTSTLDFGSGEENPTYYSSADFTSKPSCPAFLAQEGGSDAVAAAEAANYTGVQDYDDYPVAPPPGPAYYDPDQPQGPYADWPRYTGLMDRAQTLAFQPAGLDVPSYWSNGNHDVLVQGNEDANAAFEDIATACFKALGSTKAPSGPGPDFSPDPNLLLFPAGAGMLVPPDRLRRFVSKQQTKAVIGANNVDNRHGFGFVDPAENDVSNNSASYYAWDPPQTPGFRFINIDTNSEGGQTAEGVASGSSDGNIDDPQFEWLRSELDAAQTADELIVIFGHHPVHTMTTEIVDEQASPPCDGQPNHTHGDTPEHNINPGCDPDPRDSAPVHLGNDAFPGDPRESFVELIDNYPNVISYVAGHTHEHRLIPFERSDGSNWWEINTSATADWPQQHRLIDIMDNRDGTLSLFGTVLDAASPSTAPAAGQAGAFDTGQLASIGRTLSFNDPQNDFSGEGSREDRNVEMLVGDPREADLSVTKTDAPDPVVAGQPLTYTLTVTNNGPSSATLASLTDHLPPTATFVSATGPGVTCVPPVGTDVVCALGDIAPGGSKIVTITVTPQTAGTITNSADVTSVTTDPDPDNNTASAQTTVNTPPTAVNDSYSVQVSKTLSVPPPGVLANDTDPDGDALTAVWVSGPSRGTLVLNPNGSFTYKPAPGFKGVDSFTYRANDGKASSNVATVTITVTPVKK